jgi:hypothetical protein
MVGGAENDDHLPCHLTVEQLLAFPEPGHRVARFTELCQQDQRGLVYFGLLML